MIMCACDDYHTVMKSSLQHKEDVDIINGEIQKTSLRQTNQSVQNVCLKKKHG
jgi:hypothetical protein